MVHEMANYGKSLQSTRENEGVMEERTLRETITLIDMLLLFLILDLLIHLRFICSTVRTSDECVCGIVCFPCWKHTHCGKSSK